MLKCLLPSYQFASTSIKLKRHQYITLTYLCWRNIVQVSPNPLRTASVVFRLQRLGDLICHTLR